MVVVKTRGGGQGREIMRLGRASVTCKALSHLADRTVWRLAPDVDVTCREKKQVSCDHQLSGFYRASDIDCSREHPWKLKNRWSNSFTLAERNGHDTAFFRLNGTSGTEVITATALLLQATHTPQVC